MSVIAIVSLMASQATTIQSPLAQTPISLLYQPKVGSSYKNTLTLTQSGQMGNTSSTSTVTTKVLSFEQGFYKLEATTSDTKITGGTGDNTEAAKAANTVMTMYMDQHFKPKFDAGSGSDDVQKLLKSMGSAFAGVTYPSGPVQIGDTWTRSIDFGELMSAIIKTQKGENSLKASGKINLTFKLVKADESAVAISSTIGGTITMDMSETAGGMKIPMTFSGGGTSSMDRATGIPLNSDTKMNMQMNFGGQTMDFKTEIIIRRL